MKVPTMLKVLLSLGLAGLLTACAGMPGGGGTTARTGGDTATMGAPGASDGSMRTRSPHGTGGPVGASGGGPN